jgi:hypothetical protein
MPLNSRPAPASRPDSGGTSCRFDRRPLAKIDGGIADRLPAQRKELAGKHGVSRDRLGQVAYGLRVSALFDLLRKGVDRVEPKVQHSRKLSLDALHHILAGQDYAP